MTKYGYMRVSTKKQETDMQLSALKDKGCEEIFEDRGISGSKMNRPGLNSVLQKLQTGDSLVVWKLDRFGRSCGEVIVLINDLISRGVDFVSVTEGFDSSTSAGRALFKMLAVFAELEREIITERVRAGIAEYRKDNPNWGRARHVAKNHKEDILKLVAEGKSQDYIANHLGFSQAAISRFLSQLAKAEGCDNAST